MKKIYWFIIALAFHLNISATDISSIKFEHITVDNGLSQNTVEVIFQDSKGFIWFGTRDGLNKFDGLNIKIYKYNRNDSNSLASNWITAIAEDSEGNIWIGSDGLNIFNPRNESLIRINPDINGKYSFHGGKINHIETDYDQTLWLATNNGLVHYLPKEKKFVTYVHNPANPNSVPNNSVSFVHITRNNKIYVALESDPIYEFDRKKETFVEINYKKKYFGGSNYKKRIGEDKNGRIYISSEGSAMHIYYPVTGESELIDVSENSLNSANIKTPILQISDSEIWIGTDGGGVNIYNPLENTFKYLVSNAKDPYSIHGNAIYSFLKDKDDNIWIGHYGTGISVWKKDKEKFLSYFHNPFNINSVGEGVIASIYEDSKRRVWIGNDGGGLNLFDEQNKTFEHFRHIIGDNRSLSSDVIISINEQPDGKLLLGTYAAGLIVFDPDQKKVIKTYTTVDGLSSQHIWKIFPDSKGNIWLATLGSGLDLFSPENESFTFYEPYKPTSKVCSNVIMYITEDNNGRIWLGSEANGFCYFNNSDDATTNYSFNEKDNNSLSCNDVKCIVFLDKYAWIATNGGGLNRLDIETGSFKVFTTENGLSSDALMGLLVDDRKNLWISSTKGLMKFNPITEEVIIYDKSQGLQGNEFKYNSQCRLTDGRMIFGGVNGFTIFHPDSIKQSEIIPNIVFTGFKIMNEYVKIGAKGSPLKKGIDVTEFIKLKNKHRVFTLEFASLDYTTPEKNQYKYWLEGFDNDWIYSDNKNFATYTNLDPGTYTFHLKGSNSDGRWNENERTIKIKVLPPWYRSTIFILIVIVFIVFIITKYIRIRENQAEQDKKKLHEKIDEARAELQQKITEIEKQKEEIKIRDEAQKEIRYQIEGIAKFSDIIAKKRKNIEDLSTGLINELVSYVGANAGVVYISDDSDPTKIVLHSCGEFCFDSDAEKKYEFEAGEGYVGTCYLEKRILEISNLPDGYIVLRSGLGSVSLNYCVLVPVIHEKTCLGVIEIASIEILPKYKIDFIEKISDNYASVIAITKANEQTNAMLEQNQIQSEELQAQEEELRQNLEEMQATQEDLRRQVESTNAIQNELKTAKALLDTLLNNVPDYIYFKDTQSKFIRISKSMLPMFPVKTLEEMIGKSDFDFHKKENAQKFFDDEKRIMDTGNALIDDIVYEVLDNGLEHWVSTTKMPMTDSDGKVIGTFGITKDITNLKKLEIAAKERTEEVLAQEEELRQNLEEMSAIQENLQIQIDETKNIQESLIREKALLDAIMNNLPDYIYFKDLESKFIRISKSMLPLFPIKSLEGMIGKSDFDFQPEDVARKYYEDEMNIIKTGTGVINDIAHEVMDNGHEQWVATTKLPLYDETGKCIGTFGISKDITELKTHEIAAENLTKELKKREQELENKLETIQKELNNKNNLIKELEKKLTRK